ncbi:MAG: non-lysosomal glucosylceramidase [Cytophagales bacterium]|nr:non-lysosomal glucosylceramidase [Cytophagales bacterium]
MNYRLVKKKSGLLVVLILSAIGLMAQNQFGHIIPEEKGLSRAWKNSLLDKGEQKVYRGEELKTIGMPVGGIAAGQLYVRGDGTLACWWIANNAYNTGYGIDHLLNFETAQGPWKVCYQTFEPFSYFKQGFNVEIRSGGKTIKKELNKSGFDNIGFIGEYPIARILYEDKKEQLPVKIEMEAFSPFIPLNARESANPATILKFKLKNTLKQAVDVNLTGYIQNMVMADLKKEVKGKIRNYKINSNGKDALYMDFVPEDPKLRTHPYFGNMALTLLDGNGDVETDLSNPSENLTEKALGEELVGSVRGNVRLSSEEEKEITFLLTWFFPNRPLKYGDGGNWNQAILTKGPARGNMYANWYNSSAEVAGYIDTNFGWLTTETYRFHDSWYNQANLPYWLKQRIMMPVSTLATETCQWWADDKFWAWEGVGSCVGTCTHVYNYEQAIARLFPELERNIREKTDFGTSFNDDGSIDARNGWGHVLLDGHIGAILKSYREYLMSKDKLFLSRNWEKIKKAMQYAMNQDGDLNGLIERRQSNTYDISFMGPNTYVGGLYLAALRAASEMAFEMDDISFARQCDRIFESGSQLSVERLWNGHYFKQEVDLSIHPKFQYANGCLSDQLFGQTWAHQMNLGYIYPKDNVNAALNSIWKYNWTLDVGPHTEKFVPERYYAHAGEPGLLNCTWPISEHLNENAVRYRNEVWTGIEYQVATNMIYDGMLEEGLSIVKGIHERYRPEKHNPWNEIECGDHYARALASWGLLIALEDYFYHGPKGILKFSPKINKNEFNGFFTAAEAWGNISQKIRANSQINSIKIEYGKLYLDHVEFETDLQGKEVIIKKNGQVIHGLSEISGGKATVKGVNLNLNAGDTVTIDLK